MQTRRKLWALAILTVAPLSAQIPKPGYLSDLDHMCNATLADDRAYQVWDRLLLTQWNGKPSYLLVRGLYRPGSGEFLWRASMGFADEEHAREAMGKPHKGGACPADPPTHILLLQDGEWVDVEAFSGTITIFHSNLKFRTPEEAWSYLAENWKDGDSVLARDASLPFVAVIDLYQKLGAEFFRPKRLELSAQPYFYSSLGGIKKVGQNWELEIQGADKPNSATVLLDNNFKLLAVTKHPAQP